MTESLGHEPESGAEGSEQAPNPRLEQVLSDFKELEVFPLQIIQGGMAYDIDRSFYTGQVFSQADRPFTVAQVVDIGESTSENSLIYKLGPEPGSKDFIRGLNEITFLKDIAPVIYQQLPQALRERVEFPEIKKSRTDPEKPTYLVENMFKGEILGTVHEGRSDLLDLEDIETLVEFIDGFGRFANTDQSLTTNIETEHRSAVEHFGARFDKWSPSLIEHLVEESHAKAQALLAQSKTVFDRMPLMLTAGDVNPSNLIKQEDGKLGFYDWERLVRINDPSSDYTFLFVTLFHDPGLQEQLYRMAASRNDADFPICFRTNLVCNRGIGELNWWNELKKSSEDPEIIGRADLAIDRLKVVLNDAIEGTGMWRSETAPEDATDRTSANNQHLA